MNINNIEVQPLLFFNKATKKNKTYTLTPTHANGRMNTQKNWKKDKTDLCTKIIFKIKHFNSNLKNTVDKLFFERNVP